MLQHGRWLIRLGDGCMYVCGTALDDWCDMPNKYWDMYLRIHVGYPCWRV